MGLPTHLRLAREALRAGSHRITLASFKSKTHRKGTEITLTTVKTDVSHRSQNRAQVT